MFKCVSHCKNIEQFINGGNCIDNCPEPYFTSERVITNGVSIINKICIQAEQCVAPLAQEDILGQTHCTKCGEITLGSQPYTILGDDKVLRCTGIKDKCAFFTMDLVCLEKPGVVYANKTYYRAYEDSKLLLPCIINYAEGDLSN